jgi:hypothetical protein
MKINKLFIFWFLITLTLLSVSVNGQKNKKTPVTKKPVTSQKGTLSIEAGLVFKSGDVKPVARVEFYLLNKDLNSVLEEANIQSESGMNLVSTLALALSYPNFHQDTVEKAITSIKFHSVSSAITDFQGKATFRPVKTGNYYLYGFAKAGNSKVLWNLNVSLKNGQNSITLDNNNVELAF